MKLSDEEFNEMVDAAKLSTQDQIAMAREAFDSGGSGEVMTPLLAAAIAQVFATNMQTLMIIKLSS